MYGRAPFIHPQQLKFKRANTQTYLTSHKCDRTWPAHVTRMARTRLMESPRTSVIWINCEKMRLLYYSYCALFYCITLHIVYCIVHCDLRFAINRHRTTKRSCLFFFFFLFLLGIHFVYTGWSFKGYVNMRWPLCLHLLSDLLWVFSFSQFPRPWHELKHFKYNTGGSTFVSFYFSIILVAPQYI